MTWTDPDYEYEQAMRERDRRRREMFADLISFAIALPVVLVLNWWLS